MSQITIINILDKIRSICKDLPSLPLPDRVIEDRPLPLQGYLKALEGIRLECLRHRALEEEYGKLEQLLQREETELRKRIGAENQLRLYADTIKAQLQELQREKMDLLDNTRTCIKQLKRANEQLFIELTLEKNKAKSNSKSKSPSKSKASASKVSKWNRSQSHHKSKKDQSIKEIVRTEYIERENSPSRKQPLRSNVQETLSDTQGEPLNPMMNSKTYQVTRVASSNKKGTSSRKKDNHLFSNPNFCSLLETSKKKMRRDDRPLFAKSPNKDKKKQAVSRVQNPSKRLWKDKKLNRSIYSVLSLDPAPNPQKITI